MGDRPHEQNLFKVALRMAQYHFRPFLNLFIIILLVSTLSLRGP